MFNCGGWSIARGGRCYLTLVMHDGLGRVAYMAKEGEVAKADGTTNVHDLKKDYVGKSDISKYDIYTNNKTNEAFLINKQGTVIIPID